MASKMGSGDKMAKLDTYLFGDEMAELRTYFSEDVVAEIKTALLERQNARI